MKKGNIIIYGIFYKISPLKQEKNYQFLIKLPSSLTVIGLNIENFFALMLWGYHMNQILDMYEGIQKISDNAKILLIRSVNDRLINNLQSWISIKGYGCFRQSFVYNLIWEKSIHNIGTIICHLKGLKPRVEKATE